MNLVFPADAAIAHLSHNGQIVYSVVLRDVTERKQAHEVQQFLAEAGETLSSSLGSDDTHRNVTRLAVPRLADACVVHLFNAGQFKGVAVSHVDPARGPHQRPHRVWLRDGGAIAGKTQARANLC